MITSPGRHFRLGVRTRDPEASTLCVLLIISHTFHSVTARALLREYVLQYPQGLSCLTESSAAPVAETSRSWSLMAQRKERSYRSPC